MVEHLPPVGWADVATKRDLDGLRRELELRLDSNTNLLRAEFHRELRSYLFAILAANIGLAGLAAALAFAAARLA